MNPNRLTVEEVNNFNPSFDNPLEVECDNRYYSDDKLRIKIISPFINDHVAIINNHGNLSNVYRPNLKHYPSKIQPKKLVKFYKYDRGNNTITNSYFSDCGASWSRGNTCSNLKPPPSWIKTSCYIKVEV